MTTPTRLLAAALAGGAFAALAACETASPEERAEAEARQEAELFERYTRTGQTETCLSTVRIDDIDPVTDRYWLIETTNGQFYLNDVGEGCNGAASPFTYLAYETSGAQLCRLQIVRIIDRGSDTFRGSCSLGDFERLELNAD